MVVSAGVASKDDRQRRPIHENKLVQEGIFRDTPGETNSM